MPQVNLMDPSIPETDDPTNGYDYMVKEGIDTRIQTRDKFAAYLRSKSAEVCNGTEDQVITYSKPFLALQPFIIDYQGLGIEVTAFDANGFTITSLSAGTFGYLTLIES